MNFNSLFTKKGLPPVVTKELETALEAALPLMGEKALAACAIAMHRADTAHGRGRRSPHENMYEVFKGIPAYMDAARKAGLPAARALPAMMARARRYGCDEMNVDMRYLTQVMDAAAENGAASGAGFRSLARVITRSKKSGELGNALGIIELGMRAGLGMAESADIMHAMYDMVSGRMMGALYDTMDLLASNAADPALLHRALVRIIRKDADFTKLPDLLLIAATETPRTQDEVLATIADDGEETRALSQKAAQAFARGDIVDSAALALVGPTKERVVHDKGRDDYFPVLRRKHLAQGVLPYRMEGKNFAEGLVDLRVLMKTKSAEGAFVFSPGGETWYSLGGRTTAGVGRTRHELPFYDLARLSGRPVFVHVHPEKLEWTVRPFSHELAYPEMQHSLTKFNAAIPSRGDWTMVADLMERASAPIALSACIVTPTGITEMRFPQDAKAVRDFAEPYGEIVKGVILDSGLARTLARDGDHANYVPFVQALIARLNEDMPKGFAVAQHPYDLYQPFAPKKQMKAGGLGI